MRASSEWFSEWFDSPFYHILYNNHDHQEAERFINNLILQFNIPANARIADVACGKGRHSIYLNKKGFDVTGFDLSPQSIAYASQFANPNLRFVEKDMRTNLGNNEFDYVLNMFTSFGYFEAEEDNYKAIQAFANACKSNGKVIIDFMNTKKIVRDLIPQTTIVREGIEFRITKKIIDAFIVKSINFSHQGKEYQFEEKVKTIFQEDFIKYFNFAGLQLENLAGDYQLGEYHEDKSERMIFILSKA